MVSSAGGTKSVWLRLGDVVRCGVYLVIRLTELAYGLSMRDEGKRIKDDGPLGVGPELPGDRVIYGDLGTLLEESVGAGLEGRKDLGHKVGEEESSCWGVIRHESEEMGKEQENYSGILSSSFLRAQTASSVSPGALSVLHCYSAQSRDNWASVNICFSLRSGPKGSVG